MSWVEVSSLSSCASLSSNVFGASNFVSAAAASAFFLAAFFNAAFFTAADGLPAARLTNFLIPPPSVGSPCTSSRPIINGSDNKPFIPSTASWSGVSPKSLSPARHFPSVACLMQSVGNLGGADEPASAPGSTHAATAPTASAVFFRAARDFRAMVDFRAAAIARASESTDRR